MKKGIVKKYIDNKPKGKPGASAMRMGVEALGATAGSGIGAAAGIAAPFIGLTLLFVGNYFDETGIVKTAGAGMIGYGVANAMVNRAGAKSAAVNGLGEVKGNVKQRLIDFKDNLIHAFYIDKIISKKGDTDKEDSEKDLGSFPDLDTSGLDAFIDFNQELAINQAIDDVNNDVDVDLIDDDDYEQDDLDGFQEDEEINYDEPLIEEEIDFSVI